MKHYDEFTHIIPELPKEQLEKWIACREICGWSYVRFTISKRIMYITMRHLKPEYSKSFHIHNFYPHTQVVFRNVMDNEEKAIRAFHDLRNDVPGQHISSLPCFYFTPDGVYRLSDNWDNIDACSWAIDNKTPGMMLGYAKWEDFKGCNISSSIEPTLSDGLFS